jgi:hypothetical protein
MSGFTSRLSDALKIDAEINRSADLSRRRLSDALEKDQEFKLIQAVEAYEKKQELMVRLKEMIANDSIVDEGHLDALKDYVREDNFKKNEEKLINAKAKLMEFRSIRKHERSSNTKKGGRVKSLRRRQNKNKTKKRNASVH